MKKVLLISATDLEIAPFVTHQKSAQHSDFQHIDVLITGVGQLQTTFRLTKQLLKHRYDFVVQAGIAGAFDRTIALGKVVEVASEILYDLSIQDKDASETDFFDAGFIDKNQVPFYNKKLLPTAHQSWKNDLQKVHSITVNKVHGEANAIQKAIEKWNPDIENMEGAALFYVCASLNVPCAQLRAISNYVEPRNRDAWNIPLAINALNNYLIYIFDDSTSARS